LKVSTICSGWIAISCPTSERSPQPDVRKITLRKKVLIVLASQFDRRVILPLVLIFFSSSISTLLVLALLVLALLVYLLVLAFLVLALLVLEQSVQPGLNKSLYYRKVLQISRGLSAE